MAFGFCMSYMDAAFLNNLIRNVIPLPENSSGQSNINNSFQLTNNQGHTNEGVCLQYIENMAAAFHHEVC